MNAGVDILQSPDSDLPLNQPASAGVPRRVAPATVAPANSRWPHDPSAPTGPFAHSTLDQAMGLYLPATVAIRLINFLRVLILTWWMLPQQFGLFNMILLAINVLTPLCSLGLNEAITRYVPQYETRGSVRAFAARGFNLLLLITATSILLMCLFSNVLGDFFYAQVYGEAAVREEFARDAPELAQVSAVVTGLVIIYFYLLAMFKGLRMFKAVAYMEMVHSFLFLAATVAATALQHRAAITLTAVYGLSLAAPIIYFGHGFFRLLRGWHTQAGGLDVAQPPSAVFRPLHDDTLVRKLLRFSIWTTLAGFTWQLLVYYPTWYLAKVYGHVAVAIFSAPRQIGQFILIGAVAVVTVVMTTVTKTWESRGRDSAKRQLSLAFRGTGLALLVLCTAMALARNLIIKMFRQDYAPGADILPLHLLFFLIGAYLAFLPIHFHLIEKTRHLLWPWAIGVSANVLYAFWLSGPARFTVLNHPAWKHAAARFSGLFITGFSDPRGLDSAAWCGVFAIATALLLCIILIRAEGIRLDRGTYVVIAAAALLGMNSWILTIGTLLLLALAVSTDLVFTADERRRVLGYIRNTLYHVPALGRTLGRRP